MKNRNDWRTENFLYCMPIREVINVTRVFRISEKIQTLPFVFKNTCEEKSKDKFYDIFCFFGLKSVFLWKFFTMLVQLVTGT